MLKMKKSRLGFDALRSFQHLAFYFTHINYKQSMEKKTSHIYNSV